jgi:hypothetical protein
VQRTVFCEDSGPDALKTQVSNALLKVGHRGWLTVAEGMYVHFSVHGALDDTEIENEGALSDHSG